jgi:hypothetical protein
MMKLLHRNQKQKTVQKMLLQMLFQEDIRVLTGATWLAGWLAGTLS